MSDEAEKTTTPPPQEFERPDMANATDVRRELVRLYVDLRNGRVKPQLVWAGGMLMEKILRSLEVDMYDRRLSVLEEKAGIGKQRAGRTLEHNWKPS